ncbi:MAG TPA: hypothetical protein VFZ76_10130 [Anaerolineales bacterium]
MPVDPTKTIPTVFEIKVSGRLSQELAEWFGLTPHTETTQEGSTVTTLSGPISDQAALFGILNRIRDLGLKLISVNPIKPDRLLNQNWE